MPENSNQKKSSGNKTTLIILVVIAVLILLGGVGYFLQQKSAEKTAEKVIEDATGGKVDISEGGNKVTIETDEGKLTVGQNQIPDNFPSDVPVYTGAEVITSSESGDNFTLALKSTDTVSKVSDYYNGEVKSNGWTIANSSNIAGSTSITATKDGRQLNIVITKDTEGQTAIAIVINKS